MNGYNLNDFLLETEKWHSHYMSINKLPRAVNERLKNGRAKAVNDVLEIDANDLTPHGSIIIMQNVGH